MPMRLLYIYTGTVTSECKAQWLSQVSTECTGVIFQSAPVLNLLSKSCPQS